MLIRGKLLRENGRFLPRQSFLMRKQFFNDEETGYFKLAQKRPSQMANPMTGHVHFLYRFLSQFSFSFNFRSFNDDWHAEGKLAECVAYDSHWWVDQLDFFRICHQ